MRKAAGGLNIEDHLCEWVNEGSEQICLMIMYKVCYKNAFQGCSEFTEWKLD